VTECARRWRARPEVAPRRRDAAENAAAWRTRHGTGDAPARSGN